jgi:hypothetical protein
METTMKDYSPLPSSDENMHDRISAGNDTLMRQAQGTADTYMRAAAEDIDAMLGNGYAAKHPELIAAYMQTAAIDLGTAIIARAIERVETAVEEAASTLYGAAEKISEE